jgi:hypothetical protein
MIVLELVESIQYSKGYFDVMDTDIFSYNGSKIMLEVGVPKLMFVLCIVMML